MYVEPERHLEPGTPVWLVSWKPNTHQDDNYWSNLQSEIRTDGGHRAMLLTLPWFTALACVIVMPWTSGEKHNGKSRYYTLTQVKEGDELWVRDPEIDPDNRMRHVQVQDGYYYPGALLRPR